MSDPAAKSTPIRRAYGRGFHDAVRQMEQEQNMNQARLEETERSLSGIAQKVLGAVPKAEEWSIAQIVSEMRREGKNVDPSVAAGCLASMLKSGLVREPKQGMFIRVSSKPKAVLAAVVQADVAPAAQETAGPPRDDRETMQKLADLSAGVRAMALQFSDLARSIDDVAIEVEERMQAINADSEKLAQLRTLLKGIGA